MKGQMIEERVLSKLIRSTCKANLHYDSSRSRKSTRWSYCHLTDQHFIFFVDFSLHRVMMMVQKRNSFFIQAIIQDWKQMQLSSPHYMPWLSIESVLQMPSILWARWVLFDLASFMCRCHVILEKASLQSSTYSPLLYHNYFLSARIPTIQRCRLW